MSSARKPKTIDPDKVDPSVYYYDEVYDDMKQEEETERSRGRQESSRDRHKGSKYIDGLKETAELRKTEKELRKFKRYARDREEAEAEGDIPGDVYISDSYKRKLAEIKKLEEEKRRQYRREQDKSMNFVKKYSKNDKSDSHSSRRREHRSPGRKSTPEKRRRSSRSPEAAEEVRDKSEEREPTTTTTARRKRPKTIEERRKYLRELLKKRTVGKVYDEAVQRYMQRKALSQR